MDRREFLTPHKKTKSPALKKEFSGARTTSGIQPYAGPFGKNEIIHLLKRTMFGAKLSDVNYFTGKTMNDVVYELLNPTEPFPLPPVKEYDGVTGVTTPDNDVAAGATWINSVSTDGTIQSRRRASLKKWWIGCQLNQGRSILEKLTLFWHNHF